MYGIVFPIQKIEYFIVCIVYALNLYYIIFSLIVTLEKDHDLLKIKLKIFFKNHFIELYLFVLSLFFFKSALGRSDGTHLVYSSIISLILFLYIYLRFIFEKLLTSCKSTKIMNSGIIFICTIILIMGYKIIKENKLLTNFPLNKNDSHLIPENYKSTIKFLKENLKDNEFFFTFTNEGTWYYFLNQPCPSRFIQVGHAVLENFQKEIINDLKTKNIKYILLRNKNIANYIDGFSNEEKLPHVIHYIKKEYQFHIKIDDNEIWTKNF